jgi:hypothetical protein
MKTELKVTLLPKSRQALGPYSRKDLEMNMVLQVFTPDLEKMKTWKAPKAEIVK